MSRATIYKAEGGAGVAPKTGRALASALGVGPEALVGEPALPKKDDAPPSPEPTEGASGEERRAPEGKDALVKEMLIRAAGLPVFHNLLYPVLQEHASWYENLDKRIGTADNPFAVVDEESARLESDFERATRDALPLLSKGLFIKYGLPADGSGVASQKEAYRRFARGLPSEEEVNSAVLEVSVRLRPELDAEYQRKGRTLTDLRARLPEQEAARLTPETLSEIPAKENA